MAKRAWDAVKSFMDHEIKGEHEPVGLTRAEIASIAVGGLLLAFGMTYTAYNYETIIERVSDFISQDEEQGAVMSKAHTLTLG